MCSLGRLWVDGTKGPQQATCKARQPGRGMCCVTVLQVNLPSPILRHYP